MQLICIKINRFKYVSFLESAANATVLEKLKFYRRSLLLVVTTSIALNCVGLTIVGAISSITKQSMLSVEPINFVRFCMHT